MEAAVHTHSLSRKHSSEQASSGTRNLNRKKSKQLRHILSDSNAQNRSELLNRSEE